MGVEEFVVKALRGPKRGILEHSLCQHLALAIASQPLRKIRLICEAAYLLDEKTREEIGISNDDLEVIYQVCLGFVNATHATVPSFYSNIEVWSVNWGFIKKRREIEIFRRYIAPWFSDRTIQLFEVAMSEKEAKEFLEIKKKAREAYANLEKLRGEGCNDGEVLKRLEVEWKHYYAVGFFMAVHYLTKQSFNELTSMFIGWALPKVQQIFACLSRLVEPTLFEEMLGLYRTREAEGVESESVATPVGGSNEGPVG